MWNYFPTVDYRDRLMDVLLRHPGAAWPADRNERYPPFACGHLEPNRIGVVMLIPGSEAATFVHRAHHEDQHAIASARPGLIRGVLDREAHEAQVLEPPEAVPLQARWRRVHEAQNPQARGVGAPSTASRQARAAQDSGNDVGLRCLFPRPGLKRTVRFGEFKSQLAPQLAHPERLRDTHRLPCRVQIYQLSRAQTLSSVAQRLLGDSADACELLPLTEAVARRLQLPPALQDARHQQIEPGDDPQMLAAGTRLVRLRVLRDHTRDAPGASRIPVSPVSGPVQARERAAGASTGRDQRAIPERYLKPWDFRRSREEALFDMAVERSSARGLAAFVRRVVHASARRRDFRRWHALLEGNALDEQLWGVRPPAGCLSDSSIREWARKTLTSAGYDAERMLWEWELYWRRKGV